MPENPELSGLPAINLGYGINATRVNFTHGTSKEFFEVFLKTHRSIKGTEDQIVYITDKEINLVYHKGVWYMLKFEPMDAVDMKLLKLAQGREVKK